MAQNNDTAGLRLVLLGFVAVIALAGLVLMFTQQSSVTGQLSGMQKIGTAGVIERTPYEACRAVRPHGVQYIWSGEYDPWGNMISCIDPWDPDNKNKVYWAELKLAYG